MRRHPSNIIIYVTRTILWLLTRYNVNNPDIFMAQEQLHHDSYLK